MDERRVQFRVGVMLLVTLLITVNLASYFGESSWLSGWLSGHHRIYVRFREAPGVVQDTPIRKSGVRVGKVASVRLDPDGRGVTVAADIDADQKVYHDEDCCINSAIIGLGTDTVLDFVRSTQKNRPKTPIRAGETIDGVSPTSATQALGDLKTESSLTMGDVKLASGKLASTLDQINDLLSRNQDRIDSIVAKTDSTLTSLKSALDNANKVLGDEKVQAAFAEAMKKLPTAVVNVGNAAKDMSGAMVDAKEQIDRLDGFTKYFQENGNGERMARTVDAVTDDLDRILKNLNKFAEKINDPNGSLSQLASDPELYQHVSRTVQNIDALTRQLQPILDDVRAFTDKIARHPEVLGVRGAIQRSPGIK